MVKKIYDVCLQKGTYEKDGETKRSYQNIGSVMQGDNGPFMLIDPKVNLAAFPRQEGKSMLVASFFKSEDKSQAPF